VVPPVGGDTLYADAVAAYEALSPAFQRMIAPLKAVHSATRPYGPSGIYAKEEGRKGMTILPSPEAEKRFAHPLVRTLDDGRKALFVNHVYTLAIDGFSEAESAALLGLLLKHMTEDRFVYRLSWSANMLTMWDNRRSVHNATGGYDGHLRVMHRTTVAGGRPVLAPPPPRRSLGAVPLPVSLRCTGQEQVGESLLPREAGRWQTEQRADGGGVSPLQHRQHLAHQRVADDVDVGEADHRDVADAVEAARHLGQTRQFRQQVGLVGIARDHHG
jgi:hypothetical protein